MDKIVPIGQNEVQEWIRKSFEDSEGVGMSGVNMVEVPYGGTNDKGLEVKVSGVGVLGFALAAGRNKIAQPGVSGEQMNTLLDGVVEYFLIQNDEKSTELAIKKNNQTRRAYENKLLGQIISLRAQQNNLPNGTDAGEVVGKVFKGIGVALSILGAVLVSVASGGAASGLIAAAAIGLASFIADVSGGYEAMQKEISKSLQENNGYSKEEADRKAGFISMGIQFAVDIAASIAGGVSTPQQNMANVLKQAKDLGIKTFELNGKAVDKVVAAAENAVKQIAGPSNTLKPSQVVEKANDLIAQGQAVMNVQKKLDIANSVFSFVQTCYQAANQIKSIDKSYKIGETDSNAVLAEANTEAVLEVLSECEGEIDAAFGWVARQRGKVEKIISSRNESFEKINAEYGDMA